MSHVLFVKTSHLDSQTSPSALSAFLCFLFSVQEILAKSPTSIRMLKFAMNLTDDGMVGQQVFAGEATRLAYMTEEAKEGRNAFLEKRKPDFGDNQWIS